MSKRLTMTEDEAMHVLGYTNPSGRYRFSDEQEWKEARDKRDEFRLGSKFSKYCSENGINPKDVSLYWDKTKEFSILVRPDLGNKMSQEDIIDELTQKLSNHSPKYGKLPIIHQKTNNLLVIDIGDAHFGKLASSYETGESYNINIAKQRCLDGVNGIVSKGRAFGIDKVLFIIGNDVIHYDTPRRTTTSGTPQDSDVMFFD